MPCTSGSRFNSSMVAMSVSASIIGGILLFEGADPHFRARLDLAADVDGGGRVVAHENNREPGSHAGAFAQRRHPCLALEADARGDLLTIDNLCGHCCTDPNSKAR